MSTLVRTMLEAEEHSRAEALMQALQESLRLERARRLQQQGIGPRLAGDDPNYSGASSGASVGRGGGASSGGAKVSDVAPGARDTDMGHPVVQAVGRAGPVRPMRSPKPVVPEPDQIQSAPPKSRSYLGPHEPRG